MTYNETYVGTQQYNGFVGSREYSNEVLLRLGTIVKYYLVFKLLKFCSVKEKCKICSCLEKV